MASAAVAMLVALSLAAAGAADANQAVDTTATADTNQPASSASTGAASTAEPARLNVVFMLADDLGWGEVGCYGQEKIPTPNIDRLAAEGMRFTAHYSGAPVCAPARCTLLTGKHGGRAEVRTNLVISRFPQFSEFTEGQYPLSAEARTFAKVFQEAGYATGAMGKWGLGPVGTTGEPNLHGFDHFFGYNCQGIAHSFYPRYLWRNREKVVINERPIPGKARQLEGEVKLDDWIGENYAPALMMDDAEQFIANNAQRPFFLYLPFVEPHVSIHPPRESVEKFPAEWDTDAYRGEGGYIPHPRPRAGYAAMINDLDGYVGRVMAALEKAGVADHTLVIFTSDNGPSGTESADPRQFVGGADIRFFNSKRDLRGHKGSLYEGGIRVPMIARLPGVVPAGAVNDTPSYFADWFPTLCDAAGLPHGEGLDGDSLWPVLTGKLPTLENRRPLVWLFPGYGGQVAVRLGDFKVVRQQLRSPMPGEWEVYNLAIDRSEAHDLAQQHPEMVAQAKEVLRREVTDSAVSPLAIPGVNVATPTEPLP